jgi:hypothetical protein
VSSKERIVPSESVITFFSEIEGRIREGARKLASKSRSVWVTAKSRRALELHNSRLPDEWGAYADQL